MNTKIAGTGSSLPKKIVSNDDLAKIVDTSDEWISSRTGIHFRRIAEEETAASMAADAAKKALKDANTAAEDIELIIVATSSPDYAFPNTASCVQDIIGASNAACFDMSAACSGFVFALNIADAYIKADIYKSILVIGAEVMSSELDWNDRSTCVLFGDGAGAVVVKASDTGKTLSCIHSDGSKGNVLTSGQKQTADNKIVHDYIKMDGREVFKFAVKKVPQSIDEVLTKAGESKENIKYYILHQANERIIDSVAKRLDEPIDKFPMNISEYGNTSAASIPILLDELNKNGCLKCKDKLILSGFGGGLSWGSLYIEW